MFDLRSALDELDETSAIPHFVGWAAGSGGYSSTKTRYSELLSKVAALRIEEAMARTPAFRTVTSGGGTGTKYVTAGGRKSMDVAVPLDRYLGLGISVKTVGLPEQASGYVHNTKRTMEEWSLEALNFHLYMPYAIIVGLFLLPVHSAFDRARASSLWKAAHDFSHIAGRRDAGDAPSRLERVFIGLYQPKFHPLEASTRQPLPLYGACRFIDVRAAEVPTKGLPPGSERRTFDDVVAVLHEDFQTRNPLL